MKTAFVLICAAILLIAFASPVMAENVKMKDNPKCKQWHSIVGEWTTEMEYRESPNAAWKKGSGKYRIEWILDGAFVQIKGKSPLGTSYVEIVGGTHVSSGFDSSGVRWNVTSGGWDGTTWNGNCTNVSADGVTVAGRCVWRGNSDFTSATGECQTFTDGKWWTERKFKEAKVK